MTTSNAQQKAKEIAVYQACAALVANGETPTVDKVRALVRGSNSTLTPLVKAFKDQHLTSTMVASQNGLPSDLLASVTSVFEQLKASAQLQVEQVELREFEANEAHRVALAALRQELEESRRAVIALTASNGELKSELSRTQGVLKVEEAAGRSVAAKLAMLQTEREGTLQRLADRAGEISTLKEQLANVKEQYEHYQETVGAMRQEDRRAHEARVGRLEFGLQQAQKAVGEASMALTRSEASGRQLQCENDELKDRLLSASDQSRHQAQQIDQLRATVAGSEGQVVAMQNQLTALIQANAHLVERMETCKAEIAVMGEKLKAAKAPVFGRSRAPRRPRAKPRQEPD